MNDWPKVRLGEVLTERRETPLTDDLYSGRVQIIEKISFSTGQIQLRSSGSTKTGMILIRPGDLVVSGINAAKGAVAIYDITQQEPVAATIHYSAYIPNHDRIDVRFLWWMLRSRFFKDLLLEYVPGGIKTELKAKRLLPIPIPLPPLAEQKRIMARIEELSAHIHEARTLRQNTVEEAEAFLLAQLGTVFNRDAKQYGTSQLDQLIVEAGYGTSEKCTSERREGATPVLRIPNIASEKITLADLKYTCLKVNDKKRLLLNEGDILVVRTNGSLDLVGRSAVVSQLHEPTAFASYMIRLRLDLTKIIGEYAQRMLQYLRVTGVLIDLARTTAGQYNVSLGRLRYAKIPTPPVLEQRRVVAELDILQSEVNRLKRLQSETAAELDALLPAILDRAFKGEM